MPRPRKGRRVCCMPAHSHFGPHPSNAEAGNAIQMTVDEFETIRLIDHSSLTQEECAERMGVARTTVQGIYSEARKKLAACLVDGLPLVIKGGDFALCGEGEPCGYGRGGCRHCGGHHGGHHHGNQNNGE